MYVDSRNGTSGIFPPEVLFRLSVTVAVNSSSPVVMAIIFMKVTHIDEKASCRIKTKSYPLVILF